jgi:membrane-bound serine protease (ClpP class)
LIYVEFTNPGMIAPGVFGSILLLLGLAGLSVMPINWLGAALLLLAAVLFALEAKFAAHGVLGVGAAIAMVLGAVMLVNSPLPEMRIHWLTALAVAVPFSIVTALLVSLAVRARRAKVATGSEGMIGEIGAAVTDLAPGGKVFVHGEYWDAVSSRPVAAGAGVRVTAMERLRLTVEPLEPAGGRPLAT